MYFKVNCLNGHVAFHLTFAILTIDPHIDVTDTYVILFKTWNSAHSSFHLQKLTDGI